MRANYHTHTARCGHATGMDEEYVKAAIESGIRVLGFSDHIPWPDSVEMEGRTVAVPRIPDMHMSWGEEEGYVNSVRRLQEKYADKIQILLGFEAEYLPAIFEMQRELCARYGMDYLILGQHFLWEGDRHFYSGQATESEEILKWYVDLAVRGLSTGAFRYLCHPDLIHFTGEKEAYRSQMRRLCREAKRLSCPLEINLLGLATGRHYPNEEFWAIAAEEENQVILGIDAHSPEQIGNEKAWKAGLALAKKFHLRVTDELF